MTIDKQPDRTASPLAFVSDQNYPKDLDRTPDQPVADEQDNGDECARVTTPPTNTFEGFGSFSS
ncbi:MULTISPECIES: hypothetical protein [unclassified Methylobacterium]|uniref:hypothetical protein n=1 Tax=unclassified Methylobacterium TaxID=2615210 RepID=UPI0036FA9F01